MMNRRTLLTAGAFAAMAPARALGARPRTKPAPLGLILKMKEDLARDWVAVLERVAAIGYTELEFPGHLGPSANACRRELDRLGLRALAGGDVYRTLDQSLDAILETSAVLGKRYVCCYWPWLDGGKGKSVDDWKRLGETMNALGRRVRAAGLTLAYHNHDMEFRPIGEGPRAPLPYDVLLAHTEPALVTMELDLWWVHKAGVSGATWLRRHPRRFALLHVKEPGNTPEGGMACAGATALELGDALKAARVARVPHVIVENEDPQDHYACAAKSFAWLRTLGDERRP